MSENENTAFPNEITVGGRTYVIESIVGDDIDGLALLKQAKIKKATLGQEDGEHILLHQADIPVSLQGEVSFVFTGWRDSNRNGFHFIYWDGKQWQKDWDWSDSEWNGASVLRRKS